MSRGDPASAAELVSGKSGESPGGLRIVKDWIRSAVTGNLALKAVAFLLALTLFILVHSDEDEIIPVTVKLTYAAPRDGLTLVQEPPSTVRVSIQGSRRRLRRLVESELDPIQVTLTNTGEFVFQTDMVRPLPEGLSVVSISPASISLIYENTADKKVPIRARTVGSLAPGYRVGAIRVEPPSVEIRGAESALARVDELVTQPLSLTGATASIEVPIALAVPSFPVQIATQDNKAKQPQDLEVVLRVEVLAAQGVTEISALDISMRADGPTADVLAGWEIAPLQAELVVRGDQIAIDSIDLDKVRMFVRVNAADAATRVARRATVEVDGLPDGVAVDVQPRTVSLRPR